MVFLNYFHFGNSSLTEEISATVKFPCLLATDEVKMQMAVLKYLLFRFMNRSPRKYIPTNELISQLVYLGFEKMSWQAEYSGVNYTMKPE